MLIGTPAAESATPDYRVEASLRQLVLARFPKAKGATGEAPWRLRILGQVELTEQATGSRKTKGVQWDSEPHPVAEWTAPESQLLAQLAAAGCAVFAERLLDTAQQALRGQ